MFTKEQLLVSIALLLLLVEKSLTIRCYQCTSTDPKRPFQCDEFLDDDTDITDDSCDGVHGAQYCVKHVGRFEGGIGTKRFCSSLNLGNYCNFVKQRGDKLMYRTCLYTCTGDGCNSGPSTRSNFVIITSLLTISYLVSFR